MALSIRNRDALALAALTIASTVVLSTGCVTSSQGSPKMPLQLLPAPETLGTGLPQAASVAQPVSRRAVMDITFGRVDATASESGRSWCSARAKVVVEGFYRNPSNGRLRLFRTRRRCRMDLLPSAGQHRARADWQRVLRVGGGASRSTSRVQTIPRAEITSILLEP